MNLKDAALEAWQEEKEQLAATERDRLVKRSLQTFERFKANFPDFVDGAEANGNIITVDGVSLVLNDGEWYLLRDCPNCGHSARSWRSVYTLSALGEILADSRPWPAGFDHLCAPHVSLEPDDNLTRIAEILAEILTIGMAAKRGE